MAVGGEGRNRPSPLCCRTDGMKRKRGTKPRGGKFLNAQAYSGDGRNMKRETTGITEAGWPAAYFGDVHLVRQSLTNMTRTNPYAAGLISSVPDCVPDQVFQR